MDRMLTCREVETLCGLSHSTIYRKMRDGTFPEAVKIGRKAVRWWQSEVYAWLQAQPRATGETTRPAA